MDPNNPTSPIMPVAPQPVAPPMPPQAVPPAPMPMATPPVQPLVMQDTTVSMNETQTSANSMPPLAPVLPTTTVPTEQIVTPTKSGGGFIKFFLFLVIVLILIAGGVGGFIYYTNMTKLSQSPEITTQTTADENIEDGTDIESLQVLDTEIAGEPETVNFQDTKYGFSLDYLSSWDFECVSCNEIPESTASAWTVLQMRTFDYEIDEDDKIVSGAKLIVTARSTENGAQTISDLVKQKTGYSLSTYNGIEGALNLDPSQPFQGFIYTDSATGLDIHIEWKSLSNRERADKELQTILKSFKKI